MRRFFRLVLLTLVLLIVSLISAVTAMHFAIHGREVAVPSLMGMGPLEAERTASSSGLQLSIERQYYSSNIPEGRIMTQMPLPGAKVRRGWVVRVAQSLGPQRVSIPNVTGESERAAEVNIKRRGLTIGSIAELNLSDAPADQVISQSPPANASGISAPKINLLVGTGSLPETVYVMPNFVGQPLGSATAALQDAGMKLGKVSTIPVTNPGEPQAVPIAASEPGAASVIVSQTPVAGQRIATGSVISFGVR